MHRPRYDDWTLPKGKLDPGEHPLLAAVREVAEEAGVRAVPQVRLPSVRYVSLGRPKVVDFWSMRAAGDGGFQPHVEVDQLRWLSVAAAIELVSYPHDVQVLCAFADLPTVNVELTVVRHANAYQRGVWTGPDTTRMLDDLGWRQARAIAPLLALPRPHRLLSASVLRCVQTLGPLAERLDLPVEVTSEFDEPRPGQDLDECVRTATARLVELALDGRPVTVSSQGTVLPPALDRLAALSAAAGASGDHTTPKGTGWLLAFAGDRLVGADPLIPALDRPETGPGLANAGLERPESGLDRTDQR